VLAGYMSVLSVFSPHDAKLFTRWWGRRQEMAWSVWTSVCHVASNFHCDITRSVNMIFFDKKEKRKRERNKKIR
jgi:hypothetical protein